MPEPSPFPELLTDTQLSAEIGISVSTLRDWRKAGNESLGPPFLRIGRRNVRYRRADVRTWLETRLREAGSDA